MTLLVGLCIFIGGGIAMETMGVANNVAYASLGAVAGFVIGLEP